jgi:uncharacterized membrane protein YbhN (UPF0104 family)
MEPSNPRVWRLVLTGTALLGLLGLLSLALDWRELRRLAADTNWMLMPVALGLSALSYAALSYAFALVSVSVGVAAEWGLAATTLGLCFGALGPPVRPAVVLIGLTVGVAAGLLSMLPGGLGTQDGSMTGVYVLLGVPLEQAILAAILFRLVYYAFPFSASLAFYRHLQRRTAPSAGA